VRSNGILTILWLFSQYIGHSTRLFKEGIGNRRAKNCCQGRAISFPDIIVLDVNLPDQSGIVTLQQLRADRLPVNSSGVLELNR